VPSELAGIPLEGSSEDRQERVRDHSGGVEGNTRSLFSNGQKKNRTFRVKVSAEKEGVPKTTNSEPRFVQGAPCPYPLTSADLPAMLVIMFLRTSLREPDAQAGQSASRQGC